MAFEPRAEVFDDIAPHPDGIDPADQLIHERAYVVRAYRKDPETLLLRGAVRDQKPPGLYVPTDPEPLTVHHMIVDMTIAVPSLEIVGAKAVLETHPHANCPRIEDHYDNLVGLSIARGYTHGFTMDFADTAARDAYLVHPDHISAGGRLCACAEGGRDGVLVVDLEV